MYLLEPSFFPKKFFFKDFIYLFMRDTHRERGRETERGRERQRHRQREKQAPHREPNVGLDPRSGPGLKVGAKPLSHPGCPQRNFLYESLTLTYSKQYSPGICKLEGQSCWE